MNATRPSGHLARFLHLLRTPMHLPRWGGRRPVQRLLPAAVPPASPLPRAPAAAGQRPAAVEPSATHRAAPAPNAASAPATPARITRSLEEVRADLARMREQARQRSEQAQAHAQALAQLREAERRRRDIAFAPTDFMDFAGSAAAPQAPPSKPMLDNQAFSGSFDPTDFQDLVGQRAPTDSGDTQFETTAFLPPGTASRGHGVA